MNAQATCEPVVNDAVSGSRFVPHALLVVVLLLTCAARIHLRNIPLERDEGEYAYAGQLMLQGIPPYKLTYNMKLPGTYAAYAAILAVFGQTSAGIHLGLMLVNLSTIVVVFLLALRLFGSLAAIVAATSYAMLSISPSVLGFAGHATHFVVLPALLGILLLLKAIGENRLTFLFWSGTLLGLAFVMKQPGFLFVIFAGLYLIMTQREQRIHLLALMRKLVIFSAGALLPFAITCVFLWRAGVFSTFWFWTVSYASQYATNTGFREAVSLFSGVFPAIVAESLGIWLFFLVGFTAIFWHREARSHSSFLLGFLLFSVLAVCPDLLFRKHYFILLLPAISLFTGIAVSASADLLGRSIKHQTLGHLPATLFIVVLAGSVYTQRDFLFSTDFTSLSRSIYGGNPFPEAVEISNYLRAHTKEDTTIAILGSEPEIYFYTHRHSATGYIYTYGLMEEQKYALQMQNQMISEIESSRPEAIVFVNVGASWLPTDHSQTLIYSWARQYLHDHYRLDGVVEIHNTHSEFRWGDDTNAYQPHSNSVVYVFGRKTG